MFLFWRLDFDTGNFEAPALADGDCAGHDQITYTTPFTAGSVGFEALCGHLTGSHSKYQFLASI